jgi:hypothetical protein
MLRTMQSATKLRSGRAPWKDAEELPRYSAWKKLAGRRRRHANLRMRIVRGLVGEVIFAAGGIEREIQALKTAQAVVDANKGPIPSPVPRPETGPRTVGPPGAGLHAAYAVMNALTWIRTMQERVSRNDPPSRRSAARRFVRRLISGKWRGGASKGLEPAGLLASLKGGKLKKAIEAEFEKLKAKLGDARRFDNYVLHGGALPGGQTPRFWARQDGTVYFPFPDSSTKKKEIVTWEEFTYNDERDALAYLEDKFDAVATFIDDMLNAFDALPLK